MLLEDEQVWDAFAYVCGCYARADVPTAVATAMGLCNMVALNKDAPGHAQAHGGRHGGHAHGHATVGTSEAAVGGPWLKGLVSNRSPIFQPNYQTLDGSFSAVWTATIARKDAFSALIFSRSTRFAVLCTAQISTFQQKFVKLLRIVEQVFLF